MHMHMHDEDNSRPTLAQRERWLLQAIAVACSVTVAVIGLCIATMTLEWPYGLIPIVAVMASVSWTGVIALAVMVGVAKLVEDLQNEILTDQRQRREDQIRDELIDTGELNVRRMGK